MNLLSFQVLSATISIMAYLFYMDARMNGARKNVQLVFFVGAMLMYFVSMTTSLFVV